MTEKNQIYKCNVCGNVIGVLTAATGELVCCGKPMELLQEKNDEEGKEKHVPVVEESEGKLIIKVGSVPHPMEEAHYIEWIELEMVNIGKKVKKFLKPGDKPEVKFCKKGDDFKIRTYCNLHGLWKSG